MGQRGTGDADLLLDLAHGHLPLGSDQGEKYFQPARMREGLEGFRVFRGGFELGQRKAGQRFRSLKFMEIWNPCQAGAGAAPLTWPPRPCHAEPTMDLETTRALRDQVHHLRAVTRV